MIASVRWGDALAIGLATTLVATAFALAYSPGEEPTHLVVTQAGNEPRKYRLDEDRLVEVNGVAGTTEIEIRQRKARCLRSPGSNGICEAAGWLERHGDMAVSLPNRLVLQVRGSGTHFDSMHY